MSAQINIIVPCSTEAAICKETRAALVALSQDGRFNVQIKQSIRNYRGMNEGIDFAYPVIGFIDSDVVFDVVDVLSIVSKLSKTMPIISGAYTKTLAGGKCTGTNPKTDTHIVAGTWDASRSVYAWIPKNGSSGIKKVNWTGSGFLFVRTSIFRKLQYPYFRDVIIESDKFAHGREMMTEEIGFAVQCEKARIPIHVDCDCLVRHLPRENNEVVVQAEKNKYRSMAGAMAEKMMAAKLDVCEARDALTMSMVRYDEQVKSMFRLLAEMNHGA